MTQDDTVMSVDSSNRLVRPKDAAVSCSHFIANILLVVGVGSVVLGAIVFIEWRGVGSFWVGVMAVAAGIAGIYVTPGEASGGMATGFFGVLSLVTLAASVVSITLGEGAAYLIVRETGGNCFEGDDCPSDFCASDACVCWEPSGNGSEVCTDAGSVRYCLRYGGDSCSDIADSESLLMGSYITLFFIAFFSLCSMVVAISTCCYCKRTIMADSIEDPPAY